jgi:hypothetical protein
MGGQRREARSTADVDHPLASKRLEAEEAEQRPARECDALLTELLGVVVEEIASEAEARDIGIRHGLGP